MFKTLMTATAVSMLLAGGAIAQDAGGNAPSDFDVQDRAVFVNEDGSMRTDTEVRANWDALTSDRQEALKVKCEEYGKMERTEGDANTIPTPPNFDANAACTFIQGM
jgi:hypothetical protein